MALSAFYAIYLWIGEVSDPEQVVCESMVARWIYGWQLEYKLITSIMIGGTVGLLSVKLGQLASRYNLYGFSSHMAMELYPLLLMAIMVNVSSLKGCIVASLILFSMARYFKSYRAANCAGELLNGGVALGGVALLYPPAIVLWAVVPVMVMLFDRTLREVIVAHLALLIVPFAYIYIKWLWGGDLSELFGELLTSITYSSGFSIVDSFSIVSIVMLALVLYVTINAMFFISTLENTVKAKRRLRLIAIYALVTIIMAVIPSADSSTFGLLAIPASILIPIIMSRLGRAMSFIIYITLYVGVILTFLRF